MYFQRILALTGVGAALCLLAWLLNSVLANPIETGLHQVRLEQIDQARRVESELAERMLQARLQTQAGTVALNQMATDLQALIRSLRSGQAGLADLDPTVTQALNVYEQAGKDKAQLLASYAEQAEQLSLLLSALNDQVAEAMNRPGIARSDELQERLRRLLDAGLERALLTDARAADALEAAITVLASLTRDISSASDREALQAALQTASSLDFARGELDRSIDEIQSVQSEPALRLLHDRYQGWFQGLREQAGIQRQTLAIYAVCVLMAFGVIAMRLRASFSDLDRVNAELNHTNTHLEELVGERTADLNKALEDLRMQQAHLIQSEKMASLGQMVAGVAHEINTPLGYATSNVETVRELIGDQPLDAETREEFDILLGDAQHGMGQIAELVLSLKDFSRVDRSRNESIDMNEALDTALKICQNQLKDRVEVVREYGELKPIPCAPSQLNQVFLNLLTNAGQAIDGVGKIRIRTWMDPDWVRIEIRDTGCGMDEETRAHIFEPFFTTKPVGEGTGLGLSIVYRIIEDHGGDIEVKSAIGKGTAFLIKLPLQAELPSSAVVTDDEPALTHGAVA